MIYYGCISDLCVPWQFRFPDTEHYLRKYMTGPEASGPIDFTGKPVAVTEQEFSDWAQAGNAIDAFAEFCLLCEQSSEYMLSHDRCIFHAAALSYSGRAWLIAAESGVGKSTLCNCLLENYPEEITVINGDKPALQYIEDDGILVHPSPWNGKEGMHGAGKALLSGIFLLKRGNDNAIVPTKKAEAATRIYRSIFQAFQDEEIMKAAGRMTEHILKVVPVWSLTSKDVPDTAQLVYRTMKEALS